MTTDHKYCVGTIRMDVYNAFNNSSYKAWFICGISVINYPSYSNIVKLTFQIYLFKFQCMVLDYHIAGKFCGEKVWRIDSFRAFSERKFGELLDQPIDYRL